MKNNRKFYLCIILMLIVAPLLFSIKGEAADALYAEMLGFDEQGNLLMTTRDKVATGQIRYKTIGWTIKRYDLPIGAAGNETVTIMLEENREPLPDPEDDRYIYSYFYCDKDTIFQSIGKASQQWLSELYNNGGIVYMDAVMTVCENGQPCGSLSNSGNEYQGEVYFDYEGIAYARNWAAREELQSHFNKQVLFPANPSYLIQEDFSEEKELCVGMNEAKDIILPARADIAAENIFDVEQGIPGGENVYVQGQGGIYAYRIVYERCYGKKKFPVVIQTNYQLSWWENNVFYGDGGSRIQTYYVEREYSYWRIKEYEIYCLKSGMVENQVFPQGEMCITPEYEQKIEILQMQAEEHWKLSHYTSAVTVWGGLLMGDGHRPDIPVLNQQELAESYVGQISVRNDRLKIGEQVLSDDVWKENSTDAPIEAPGTESISFSTDCITIPETMANGEYTSAGFFCYQQYGGEAEKELAIQQINPVVVHMPVVCTGSLSDDKDYNQMINPSKDKVSWVLGRTAVVTFGTEGEHLSIPGYGNRSYEKYVQKKLVCFPFDIIRAGEVIKAGKWIEVKDNKLDITIPEYVKEGNYEAELCVTAKNMVENAKIDQCAQERANISRDKTAAFLKIPIQLSGRLYGLRITDVSDYPRWKRIFEGKQFFYPVGNRDENGQENGKAVLETLPLLAGSNPYDRKTKAVGLGYKIEYECYTIGSFGAEEASLRLNPVFYYLDKSGENKREADIYYPVKKDGETVWVLAGSSEDTVYKQQYVLNASTRRKIRQGVYAWRGSCYLPAELLAVPKGFPLAEYLQGADVTRQEDFMLKNGYILIQIFPEAWVREEGILSYVNQENAFRGYCNMWEKEGFYRQKTDALGTVFNFEAGDAFLFDMSRSFIDDYVVYGTH